MVDRILQTPGIEGRKKDSRGSSNKSDYVTGVENLQLNFVRLNCNSLHGTQNLL